MEMDELKPCPFCGKKAVFQDMGQPDIGRPLNLYRIVCTFCGANVTSLKYPGIGKKEVIVKWNKRKVDGVVRCRDCKFYYGVNEECGCNGGYHSEDWFCADGERRIDDA